jgi:hypothetical protein
MKSHLDEANRIVPFMITVFMAKTPSNDTLKTPVHITANAVFTEGMSKQIIPPNAGIRMRSQSRSPSFI